jgi:hypothetical protein
MRSLSSILRKQLESAVLAGRRASEYASRAALDGLGVFADRRPEHLDNEQASLRNGLRAKWRQLGGNSELLVTECAYEQWHRLLFARFLAENQLLLHPQFRAAVTLVDCDDLAAELGEPDGWAVAARFAAEILPGIFRLDDPCVRLRLAPEGRFALEDVIIELPSEVFAADDALGWVYQFWQKDKKDEINKSERKIGGADLGPVTQLFTENYMVRFLLENSLGAWWASRYPNSPIVKDLDYLRLDENGKPAAGSFDGWPQRAEQVTVMDPCCGSGHFLVEALSMLWQMRAEEEGLRPIDAQDAVLRDNLFGLELDPRCVQIAMFAVALKAWKAGGGWRAIPIPNIACSGIPVKAPPEEWRLLARDDSNLENVLARLHLLFCDADTLGSLIDPRQAVEGAGSVTLQTSFDDVNWNEVAPLLEKALKDEESDPTTAVLGADAAGIARAAGYLSRSYTLIATNPPFLGRGAQISRLRSYSVERYRGADPDLAATMADRWASAAAYVSLVLPQSLLYMGAFRDLRDRWLSQFQLALLARLGAQAFVSISGEVVQVALFSAYPRAGAKRDYVELDASSADFKGKLTVLMSRPMVAVSQVEQWRNPGHVMVAGGGRIDRLLEDAVDVREGLKAGDVNRFEVCFWEVASLGETWEYFQDAPGFTAAYTGRSRLVRWENESGQMAELAESVRHLNHIAQNWRRGKPLWGKAGIVFSLMGSLKATLYTGERFGANCAAIVPNSSGDLAALWEYAKSGQWETDVRAWHHGLAVTAHNITRVSFDAPYWRECAKHSGGLPEPWSDDPTQWLFTGRPENSSAPLHVAVARLLGYRWPGQEEPDDLDPLADDDGIVCLPSVAGEPPAIERLQHVLAQAFGAVWSPAKLKELLERAGSKQKTLADWLSAEFFKQHCSLFANRPHIWHIWDGQRDGFSALVNYHVLTRKTLERLTYTYLGQDWVERQRAGVRDKVVGAEARLVAALELQRKLEMILNGEEPHDIYVRWKKAHEQPVGWEPDLNDGVRLNIRPFVQAGVLRAPFNVHWKKDKGKNPDGSERDNDVHLSLAEKVEARRMASRP